MTKVSYFCPVCGSDEINIDAHAFWSFADQEFKLEEAYPEELGSCNDCGESIKPRREEVHAEG
jgi:rRNA maturation endonuclease Nob1